MNFTFESLLVCLPLAVLLFMTVLSDEVPMVLKMFTVLSEIGTMEQDFLTRKFFWDFRTVSVTKVILEYLQK